MTFNSKFVNNRKITNEILLFFKMTQFCWEATSLKIIKKQNKHYREVNALKTIKKQNKSHLEVIALKLKDQNMSHQKTTNLETNKTSSFIKRQLPSKQVLSNGKYSHNQIIKTSLIKRWISWKFKKQNNSYWEVTILKK